MNYICSFFVLSLFLVSCQPENNKNLIPLVVGTYTQEETHVNGKGHGIYIAYFNPANGILITGDTIREIVNPSYITKTGSANVFFAVEEIAGPDSLPVGRIKSFEIDFAHNNYRVLDTAPSFGDAPCHISFIGASDRILIANYMHTIASYEIDEAGAFEEGVFFQINSSALNHYRQDASHPHMIQSIISDRIILVSDLGANKLFTFRIDNGEFVKQGEIALMPDCGPRHFVLNQDESMLYVLCELSNSIEGLKIDSLARFSRMEIKSTLAERKNLEDNNAAAIKMHPSGNFLYTSNRATGQNGLNTIAAFKVNENGTLKYIDSFNSGGDAPRDFAIDPSGNWLLIANQNADNIIIYKIDLETGRLSDIKNEYSINTPVCLLFVD